MLQTSLRKGPQFHYACLSKQFSRCNSIEAISKTAKIRSRPRSGAALSNTEHHHDLPSFLAYAARTNLSTRSTTYIGNHYEYTVASALSRLYFSLTRQGGRSDLGIDLIGHWNLPTLPLPASHPLRVIVQCKARADKLTPSVVRELEGAFIGAPTGWRGKGVIGLLATPKAATKGIREAMGRSEYPMGFIKLDLAGRVEQFLWNRKANDLGLAELGVTLKYLVKEETEATGEGEGERDSQIMLTWKGTVIEAEASDGRDESKT